MISTQHGHSSFEDLPAGSAGVSPPVAPPASRPKVSHVGFDRQQESPPSSSRDSPGRPPANCNVLTQNQWAADNPPMAIEA